MAGSASSMRTGPTGSWNSGARPTPRDVRRPDRAQGRVWLALLYPVPRRAGGEVHPAGPGDPGGPRRPAREWHKSFCVGPGCTHPSGGRYEVVNDAPLLEIPWSELKVLVVDPCTPPERTITVPKIPRTPRSITISDALDLRVTDFLMPLNPSVRESGRLRESIRCTGLRLARTSRSRRTTRSGGVDAI